MRTHPRRHIRSEPKIYLEPKEIVRAHRQASALARRARISMVFQVFDHACGMALGMMLFIATMWMLSVTGPLTDDEKAFFGRAYVGALSTVEASARDLRLAYDERAPG